MMLAISTLTYDPDGHLYLDYSAGTDIASTKRRVSKTATLDGGVSLVDMGYTDSDRQFFIEVFDINSEKAATITRLMTHYPLLVFSCREGCFTGVISELNTNSLPCTFKILVKEKISA